MTKPVLKITVCSAVLLLAAGCSGYNKLLKSNDREQMYKAALDYFEKGKFDKTLQLFEEIAPYYQGTVREDTILFYTADAHFRSRDYQLSSMEFDDFRRRFGRSPFVEEAEYKYAMGFYYMSPPANRDQTSTYMAITSINEYLQRYPNSLKKQLCLIRLDELQQTLYDKSFINARTYYKIGRYKSAIVSLKNALKQFPDSNHREEIMYMIVDASYRFANNSVANKQTDRYLSMLDSYYTFIAEFPESTHRKEVDRMAKHARDYLDRNKKDEDKDNNI